MLPLTPIHHRIQIFVLVRSLLRVAEESVLEGRPAIRDRCRIQLSGWDARSPVA